jgi:hypothetical protein
MLLQIKADFRTVCRLVISSVTVEAERDNVSLDTQTALRSADVMRVRLGAGAAAQYAAAAVTLPNSVFHVF